MIPPNVIPDDDDIKKIRMRYAASQYASIERRERAVDDRPDRVSDIAIGVVMVLLVVAVCVFAFLGHGAKAAHGATRTPARSVGSREALIRRLCPPGSILPRSACLGWLRVAQCETGGQERRLTLPSLRRIRWRYNGSSGFDGGVQFGVRTWNGNIGRVPARSLSHSQRVARARGDYGFAYAAPASVQILTAEALRVRPDGGLHHWPRCGSRFLG